MQKRFVIFLTIPGLLYFPPAQAENFSTLDKNCIAEQVTKPRSLQDQPKGIAIQDWPKYCQDWKKYYKKDENKPVYRGQIISTTIKPDQSSEELFKKEDALPCKTECYYWDCTVNQNFLRLIYILEQFSKTLLMQQPFNNVGLPAYTPEEELHIFSIKSSIESFLGICGLLIQAQDIKEEIKINYPAANRALLDVLYYTQLRTLAITNQCEYASKIELKLSIGNKDKLQIKQNHLMLHEIKLHKKIDKFKQYIKSHKKAAKRINRIRKKLKKKFYNQVTKTQQLREVIESLQCLNLA